MFFVSTQDTRLRLLRTFVNLACPFWYLRPCAYPIFAFLKELPLCQIHSWCYTTAFGTTIEFRMSTYLLATITNIFTWFILPSIHATIVIRGRTGTVAKHSFLKFWLLFFWSFLKNLCTLFTLHSSGSGTRTHGFHLMRVTRWPLLYSAVPIQRFELWFLYWEYNVLAFRRYGHI